MSTITLDELLAIHDVVVAKETADKAALVTLTSVTKSSEALRPLLSQWAAGGFSTTTPILSVTIAASGGPCGDGIKRAICEYIEYLLETTMSGLMSQLTALAPEVVFTYAFPGDAAIAVFAARGRTVPPAPVVPAPPAPAPEAPTQ
jgi:hypothetical protein